ncbi:hypothetical protein DRO24_01360, partial [Candidatus Bathyarchaeota archaeon]
LSAKALGVQAWKNKCKVYVGYVEEFAFVPEEEEKFKQAANYGLIIWLEGEEDWANIKHRWIQFWNKLIDETKDFWTRMLLRHNRDALRIYNAEPPKTGCFFRKIAVKLFGKKLGWKIEWRHIIYTSAFMFGTGVSLHDFMHQVFQLKGTFLSLEGGYIGFTITVISFFLLLYDSVRNG